jgi:hypothetical protein
MHRARVFTGVLASLWVALFVVACQDQSTSPVDVATPGGLTPAKKVASNANEQAVQVFIDGVNAELVGEGYQLGVVEYITSGDSEEMGLTVLAKNVGNKQLGHHFIPGDPNRPWGAAPPGISWVNDQSADGATTSGLSAVTTFAAISRSMSTWQAQSCSTIPLVFFGNAPFDIGFVQFLQGFGGSPFIFADLTHGGWLPGPFWDTIAPGGSTFILGATFTFIFIDCAGPATGPCDNDGNGKADTAFREIYYNDAFFWDDDTVNDPGPDFDVETVATHEMGHGLSQGHFGMIAFNPAGKLLISPRASMNAIYAGPFRSLAGTDNGGHCSIWASWPVSTH